MVLVHNLPGNFLCEIWKKQKQNKIKKPAPGPEAGHTRLEGDGFNKQRELTNKACFGQEQDERIPAPDHQILKVFKEAFTGFSHIYHVGVFNTASLSQGYVLGAASGSGKNKQNHIPKTGEEGGASDHPGPDHGSTGDPIFLMTFANMLIIVSLETNYF